VGTFAPTSHKSDPALPPLADRLTVDETDSDVFIGKAPLMYQNRVYGGHTLAQALLAADATLPDSRHVASLQAYFVSPGDPRRPLHYSVSRLRDGRSFSVRSVEVAQNDRVILTWRGLFGTTNGTGDVLQLPIPQVPDPESLPPLHHRHAGAGQVADGITWPPGADWRNGSRPFDIRYVDSPEGPSGARCFWFRTEVVDSSHQNIQRAILAFASDRSLAAAISHARGDLSRGIVRNIASLDHALWFHGDVHSGEWLLYVQSSPFSTDDIGIAQGSIYDYDGRLIATVMQQGIRRA
jgi:acyl-CoA thioesterase-2